MAILLFSISCSSKNSKNDVKEPLPQEDQKDEQIEELDEDELILRDEQGLIIDENEIVVGHSKTANSEFKTLKNLRFGFEIDVPTNWSAQDQSRTGDGFIISIPEIENEIRVYGETADETIISITQDLCSSLADFTFYSGHTGSLCVDENSHTYSIIIETKMISVYIQDFKLLNADMQSKCLAMAKSLAFNTDKPA